MSQLQRTPFYDQHLALNAKMVEFGGWEMPLMYPDGIIQEHLNTRRGAGLFDVSHMGRFRVRGKSALPFLQHVLTNNAAALSLYSESGQDVGAQYTLIPTETGGAVDDAVRVHEWHFPAAEFNHFSIEGQVLIVKRGSLKLAHGSGS